MGFNFNKLTVKAQEVVQEAIEIAQNYNNQIIEPEHLLASFLQKKGNIALSILEKTGGNVNNIKIKINELLEKLPKVSGSGFGNQQMSNSTSKLFDSAAEEARSLKDEYVSNEHILLALSDEKGKAGQLLRDNGVSRNIILSALKDVRGIQRVTSQNPEDTYKALEKYGRNLNEAATHGKLDPVIGRDEEIRRVLQVLSRRTKNNPVLIGEPGVGKTAIAEGLAHRIISGDVPENLKTKQIVALDIGSLVAGTQFRGQFEERMKAVLKEVQTSNGEIILFIDELHTLVGAGAVSGSMDAANILKPALARGELHAIGATTLDEYKKHIEKDAALERRFQPVMINEPSEEDTISILRGLKERYEVHHGVRITDGAIIAASHLSERYIADRFLPDKAIDLVDEAASKLRIEIDSMPEELDTIERTIQKLEIEREALKKEKDEASKKRLKDISKELGRYEEQRNELKMHWILEKEKIQNIRKMKYEIENAKTEADKYEREGNLGKVAEIRYGKITEFEKNLKSETERLLKIQKDKKMLKEEVDAEDIAEVVAKWTGIPVSKMLESEKSKLLKLEDELHKRIIGQNDAVFAIANAIRRSRTGLQDVNRPIGSFIFLGTTGVGKTELARALAEFLFDNEKAMIRIDMSEYMEKFSVSRLIGAPPGYVGYEEGGQLTEAVRRRPYSVVLLDEIEKAHSDVFNVLLQVLDDGRLTDNQGRTVNFKNTIIIMTSNLGSNLIQEKLQIVTDDKFEDVVNNLRQELTHLLRKTIRPEFLNRIDEVVLFKPLTKKEIRKIVDIQLKNLQNILVQKQITLDVNNEAKDWLAKLGYDVTFGARPLKRTIQKHLTNPLSQELLAGNFYDGDTIIVELGLKGRLVFKKK
ncbi:MAG: ATP-dependent chaperone ClpB [Ignavibacteriales bacterium CG_4_9_14_3_um_filter_30_11]|nr:MAG: ATP-dependent chaperone ClpB [Ignavibacteriales bacterium CG_4_9_14_3_um_filter_30_11]